MEQIMQFKNELSFTYGDSYPTFRNRVNDGKYRPDSYIEAHIWSDEVIGRYLTENKFNLES